MLEFKKAQQKSRAQRIPPPAHCSINAPSISMPEIADRETTPQPGLGDHVGQDTEPRVVLHAALSDCHSGPPSDTTSRKSVHSGDVSVQNSRRPKRQRESGSSRKIQLTDLGLVGVTQTILGRGPEFGEPTSNCLQAALATVLRLPLDAVPHFPGDSGEGWWDRMNTWLTELYGVTFMSCTAGSWEVPRVLHLSQGLSVRDVPHVVVAFGGQLLHDPHPSRTGLSTVLSHELFLVARPEGLDAFSCAKALDALEVGRSAHPLRIPQVALDTTLGPSGVKRCTRCGVIKPLGEFPRVPKRQRMSSWCKPCSYRSVKAGGERLRLEVLAHYSGGTMRCACCGQDRVPFLALDHIDGDGARHRNTIGAGASFYRWLKQNGFPPGLQVLCHNCNLAKSAYGSCPHTRKKYAAPLIDSAPAGEEPA